jgi:O-antigen/teichoic acid export membrane protein
MIKVKIKRFVKDGFLSVVSRAIPILILQFIIHPFLGESLANDEYGNLITVVALVNFSALTLGNVLNNSRLILEKKYINKGLKGDFNVLLIILLLINIVAITSLLYIYLDILGIINFIILLVISIFILVNGYLTVEFRIDLNYNKIAFDSVFLSSGYVLGYFIYLWTGYWEMIYLIGVMTSAVFLITNTNILKEPIIITNLFGFTSKQTSALLISGLLVSGGMYLDKILLFPLLGGEAVATYYVASLLGKSIGLVIGPLSGLLLSYLAKEDYFSNRKFIKLLYVSLLLAGLAYIIVLIIDEPILNYLYPKYATAALDYIAIITLSVIILVLCNLLNAIVLNFLDLKWQILINGSYLLIYIVGSLILFNYYGLFGFCIGILLASISKLIFIILLFYKKNAVQSLVKI